MLSCGIIPPNRSTYCSDCNNCIERLDHHCPWIGNCAGKRNYLFFFVFLFLFNILCILFIIFSIAHIIINLKDYKNNKDKNNYVSKSFCETIISLYLIIYCFIIMCFIVSLLIYHLKLIINNITTKEELRNAFKNNQGNPYKRSIFANIKNILIPKLKKYSILDILREDIEEISDYNDKGNCFYLKKEDINLKRNDTKEALKQKEIFKNINYIREDSKPINEEYRYDNNTSSNDKSQNNSIDIHNSYFNNNNISFSSSTYIKEDINKKNYLSKNVKWQIKSLNNLKYSSQKTNKNENLTNN